MLCKLCGEDTKLIKAHVIPESMYPFRMGRERTPLEVRSNDPDIYPHKSPKGIYDRDLVCLRCERTFSSPDDYAKRLLVDGLRSGRSLHTNGELLGTVFETIDTHMFKRFWLSLLWRAAETEHPFFSAVNLGKYSEPLRSLVLNQETGSDLDFPAFLARFDDRRFGTAVISPLQVRLEGVRFTVIYLAGYVLHIKTDRRKMPEPFNSLKIQDGAPLIVLNRELRGTQEFAVMKELAKGQRS